MYKEDIIEEVYKSHRSFIKRLRKLNQDQYNYKQTDNKWSAGQGLDHINKVISKISFALSMPKWILKFRYGISNRASRPYDELRRLYLIRINDGASSPTEFIPKQASYKMQTHDCNKCISLIEKVLIRIDKLSEYDLDMLLLPHPILGEITLREMMYFCKFHVEIHEDICRKNLNSMPMIFS